MATSRDMPIGTTLALGDGGEATRVFFYPGASASGIYAKTDLWEQCQQLKAENIKLKAENISLRKMVVAMQATNSAEQILEIRDLSREQAKKEVRAFFKAHHGETIYPSDVMEALSLDYDLVYEICEELEQEGKIKGL